MNISLPDSLKEYVDQQVSSLGFGSSSEYVRGLIRKDRDRQRLRGLLYEGAASSSAVKIDSDYFDRLRDQVREAGERGAARHAMPMNWISTFFAFCRPADLCT